MDRSVLEQPFPPERVRRRSTPDGATLSYVSAADVIERLNEAFEADWSFTVVEHRVDGDEVLVTGCLRAGDVEKQDFGGARINGCTRADALKAATSDALRRCARMLGVGLDLWRGDTPSVSAPVSTPLTPDVPRAGFSDRPCGATGRAPPGGWGRGGHRPPTRGPDAPPRSRGAAA